MSVSIFHLHLRSLIELKQSGTVVEYTAAFWERLHLVLDLDSDLNIKSFVDQYVKGLRGDIQAAVRSRSPSSITCASSLARIREDEIAKDAAKGADKLGVSDGLAPTGTVTDVSPEPAAPVQCRAGQSASTIDVSCSSALTPTTGSMECPGSDATVDVLPKLAASAERDEDLDTVSVAALPPSTCSTGGLAHGRSEPAFSSCPATQGTWPYLQPKPPWVYSVHALFSQGPERWEHFYTNHNLNLLLSPWNVSSPELPLYWNDWFMGYNITDLVAQKNWDPGGMLQSGCAPLAFPRCFCISWDPCSTEANHRMEQLSLNKFGLVCKATCTVTHQLDPEILVGSFHVHSVGTLKFVMVRQYSWKVQVIDYLVFGVKEWVQDIQCVQLSSVVCDAPPVWYGHHIVANASVLEILARELCMGYISADFNGISRVHLPPWLPPILFTLEVTLWMNNWNIGDLAYCTHGLQKFIGISRTRMIWSVAWLLNYHCEVVHADCHMIKESRYKMERQRKLGGIGIHSCLLHSVCLPNNILVAAWKLRSTENTRAQYKMHHGEGNALVLGLEQKTTMLVMIPELVLALQGLQWHDLLIVLAPHGVYWIALVHVVTCVEVLEARAQWDPGVFLSTRGGENKTNHHESSRRLQRIAAQGYRLAIGLSDSSTPWDPGIVTIHDAVEPVHVKARRPPCRSGSCKLLQPMHAIAWGQAMFCGAGSVTPGIFLGPHLRDGLLTRGRPNASSLGDGRIKTREVNWREYRPENESGQSPPSHPLVHLVPHLMLCLSHPIF